LEAFSTCSSNLVNFGGTTPQSCGNPPSGFFWVMFYAFADEMPVTIAPDDVWGCITYAFQRHVNDYAEKLRHLFVKHEGKKELEVRVDHMVLGQSKPEVWEKDVFASFSKQVLRRMIRRSFFLKKKKNITDQGTCRRTRLQHNHSDFQHNYAHYQVEIREIILLFYFLKKQFRAASEVTLMSSMSKYFSYSMMTCCGIPEVTLKGTLEDWKSLRAKADAIGELMLPEFKALWLPVLLPVLDEFVHAYEGRVNHEFWQSCCKRYQHGQGSGSYSTISGWISLLYPYLDSGVSKHLKPWKQCWSSDGPRPENFPVTVSSVDCVWNYLSNKIPLKFHAGILGAVQLEDGSLSPSHMWFVSHGPGETQAERLFKLKEQVRELEQSTDEKEGFSRQYVIKYLMREIVALEKQ
jgi:hypothetical protein